MSLARGKVRGRAHVQAYVRQDCKVKEPFSGSKARFPTGKLGGKIGPTLAHQDQRCTQQTTFGHTKKRKRQRWDRRDLRWTHREKNFFHSIFNLAAGVLYVRPTEVELLEELPAQQLREDVFVVIRKSHILEIKP